MSCNEHSKTSEESNKTNNTPQGFAVPILVSFMQISLRLLTQILRITGSQFSKFKASSTPQQENQGLVPLQAVHSMTRTNSALPHKGHHYHWHQGRRFQLAAGFCLAWNWRENSTLQGCLLPVAGAHLQ
jgi:hypothetical protein